MVQAHGQLQRDGYALLHAAMPAADCGILAGAFPVAPARAGGIRNALRAAEAHAQASVDALHALAGLLLQAPARAVRAILFDKSPSANWAVAWHRDVMIPVRERHEVQGYRNWSMKDGVWHVQAPREVLRDMLTLRLHLDDCDARNGALRVVAGSHRPEYMQAGMEAEQDAAAFGDTQVALCTAKAGDVLAMRPCLLHASAKAEQPARRRILHIEYAAFELPRPLQWAEA
jgi:ectoine hydroxylase-related dioxygenase (phytanoyl-CoA dioxygenase family)